MLSPERTAALRRVEPPTIAALRGRWTGTSFLGRIPEAVVVSCLAAGRCYEYAARETLIREGARDRDVHLLLSGCVKVTAGVATESGLALLGIRVGGDVVGELAALDGRERSASVQVCGRQPAVCCVLDPDAFNRALVEHSDVLLTLMATVGAKLRASTRRRIDYVGCAPVVRMARVLVELAEDHGHCVGSNAIMIGVNLVQVELGTLIGVREATAQRALRQLRESGLVVTSSRRPMVRDLDRLRAVARL